MVALDGPLRAHDNCELGMRVVECLEGRHFRLSNLPLLVDRPHNWWLNESWLVRSF